MNQFINQFSLLNAAMTAIAKLLCLYWIAIVAALSLIAQWNHTCATMIAFRKRNLMIFLLTNSSRCEKCEYARDITCASKEALKSLRSENQTRWPDRAVSFFLSLYSFLFPIVFNSKYTP